MMKMFDLTTTQYLRYFQLGGDKVFNNRAKSPARKDMINEMEG
jgi:hypothetical protein